MNVLRFSDLCDEGRARGRRVFIRADLNVPQDDAGNITEDTRIRASVPCPELAKKMAALCDIYVNDAFGTAHRAEATTYGIAEYAQVACAGPLLAAEID